MLTRTNEIACDDCGKFISYQDLANGKATHRMTIQNAYGTEETWKSQCPHCKSLANGQEGK